MKKCMIGLLLSAFGYLMPTSTYAQEQRKRDGYVQFEQFDAPLEPSTYVDMTEFLKEKIGISDPNVHFTLYRVKQDSYGNTHEKYQQMYADFPVEQREFIIHKTGHNSKKP